LTTLGTVLATTERLLVLDNCEHVLPSCARVAEALLRACPRLRILATSREPLRVGAEVVWRVPPLGLPDDDARALRELAGRGAGPLPAAGRLRRRLDGRRDRAGLRVRAAAERRDPGPVREPGRQVAGRRRGVGTLPAAGDAAAVRAGEARGQRGGRRSRAAPC